MAGKRYAVLIGNGAYEAPSPGAPPRLPTLRCPSEDVDGLKKLLSADAHGAYDVLTLVDRPHGEAEAAIYDVMINRAKTDDLVLVYYSGHGKLDSRGQLYLAGSDTNPGSLPPTATAAASIRDWVSASPAAARMIILDCCYSGAIYAGGRQKGELADQAGQRIRELSGRGIFYLTASTDTQTAEEKDQDKFSLLTKHIIDGVQNGRADGDDDGTISFQDLCGYVQQRIAGEGTQRPLVFTERGSGDVYFASTGKPAFSARRKEVERKLYSLASDDVLSGEVVSRLQGLLQDPKDNQRVLDPLHRLLSERAEFVRTANRLADERLPPVIDRPVTIERKPDKIPPGREEPVNVSSLVSSHLKRSLIGALIGLSIAAIAAGWLWFDRARSLPSGHDMASASSDTSSESPPVAEQQSFDPIPQPTESVGKAAPASVVAAPQVYLILFDYHSSAITPASQAVINRIVWDYREGQYSSISITGYTDRSGNPEDNLALSEKMADGVRAALIGAGIPDTAITTAWKGEAENAVPTTDGVKEQANRRVEVVIQ